MNRSTDRTSVRPSRGSAVRRRWLRKEGAGHGQDSHFCAGDGGVPGTTAMLANSGRAARQPEKLDTQTATDGAFRDGLYVGRLAAEGGRPPHPQIGRWSNEHDRTSFVRAIDAGTTTFLPAL